MAPRAELFSYVLSIVFFFQAEDGIRDLTVTGVQTCALPISFSRGVNPEMPREEGIAQRDPLLLGSVERRLHVGFGEGNHVVGSDDPVLMAARGDGSRQENAVSGSRAGPDLAARFQDDIAVGPP